MKQRTILATTPDTGSERRQDILAVAIWTFGAVVVASWAFYLSFQVSSPSLPTVQEVVARFARFDFIHFDDIARLGYLPEPGTASTAAPLYAFFPAVPMLLRLGTALTVSSVTTGLLVSFVSGAFATAWIRRIADMYLPGLGLRAAAVFVLAPPAIFLYAPYTESLFLAFALGAWYFGMRGKWLAASVLCAFACTVRISGAFLLVALMVLWLTEYRHVKKSQSGQPLKRTGLFFVIPVTVLAGWMEYLAVITGDQFAYQTAQKYWGRHFTWPWDALTNTIEIYPPTGGAGPMGIAETIAVGCGVIVTVALIYRRLYGESVFVGLNVLLLGTSTYFYSVPRSALLWWPLWIGIAYLLRRSKIALAVYLLFSLYLMIRWASLLLTGQWAG